EGQRNDMDATRFAQDFQCEFTGSGRHAFDRDVVEAALDEGVEAFSTVQLMAERPGAANCQPTWLSSHTDRRYYIGVDLGKKQDHSTIAIVESGVSGDRPGEMQVHCAERILLGTPYTRVVEMGEGVGRSPRLAGRGRVGVDGAGVGEPVVEM